jgi:hypothetical protein
MLSLLLSLAAPEALNAPAASLSPQEAAERVSQCGLGAVSTKYDPDLHEDVLIANDAQPVTNEQLACAFGVVDFYYTLQLPANVQPRFDAMLEAKATIRAKSEASSWLAARNLLDRVPAYQKGLTNEATFTRDIENLCGPKAKGAFQSKYGFHALSPDWFMRLGMPPKPEASEALTCLMRVAAFTGFKVGFIGNEAAAPAR